MSHKHDPHSACGSSVHLTRRALLKGACLTGLTWLTPLADLLAIEADAAPAGKPARSVIMLWLAGGPSQLDTFDPQPGSAIGGGVRAIDTALPGVRFAAGLEQTASVMGDVSLIRSMVSKEGDHERAVYNIKTGYRPVSALAHPSIGAIVCHELPDAKIEIPTHVSILANRWPARGGFLGAEFDAFQIGDPAKPVPDVRPIAGPEAMDRRLADLQVVERAFARGRRPDMEQARTLHQLTMGKARRIMSSDQLKAFDVSTVPAEQRAAYGDTPFGRGCLAAVRLIEAGVRCVEVTLNGWDTHANNAEGQAKQVAILDAAYASLIRDLKARGLLEHTIVLCGGEFGRTPKINLLDGRDHWSKGFSMLVAGGGFTGGRVIGETDPAGVKEEPADPIRVEDLHATVQHLLGIDYTKEIMTSIGRPIALSDGRVIRKLKA